MFHSCGTSSLHQFSLLSLLRQRWICEIGADQSHASWSFPPSLAVPFGYFGMAITSKHHSIVNWNGCLYVIPFLIFSWWKMLEDQLIIQHLLEKNIFGSRGERIREICLADCLICFYCGYIRGSSKWPRLDPQVTFWGLKSPSIWGIKRPLWRSW